MTRSGKRNARGSFIDDDEDVEEIDGMSDRLEVDVFSTPGAPVFAVKASAAPAAFDWLLLSRVRPIVANVSRMRP